MIVKLFNKETENIKRLQNYVFLVLLQIMFQDYEMNAHTYEIIIYMPISYACNVYTHTHTEHTHTKTHTHTHINCIQLKNIGLYSRVKLYL